MSPRDAARLMVVRPGAAPETEDRIVRDLPDLLRAGDVMVVNRSRQTTVPVTAAGPGDAGVEAQPGRAARASSAVFLNMSGCS